MFLLSNSLVIDLLPLVEYLFDQGQKPFRHWSKEGVSKFEGTEKVSLQLFKELNLHIACILFGYVQIFCTLMP